MKRAFLAVAILTCLSAYAFGGGQISVMDPITKLPKYIKGGTGIDINPGTGIFTATGTAVISGSIPFSAMSSAGNAAYLAKTGTATNASAYKGNSAPTGAEFGYVAGATSNLQSQLNSKATTAALTAVQSQVSSVKVTAESKPDLSNVTPSMNGIALAGTGPTASRVDHVHPVDTSREPANSNIQAHIGSTSNPHSVTKSQVGLGNVDNTSDLAKPISTATQTALNLKANTTSLATVATTGSYTDLTNKPAVYTLPTASTTVKGGVKVDGTSIVVDGNGVISSTVSAGVSTVNGATGDVTVTPANIGAAALAAFTNYTSIDRVTKTEYDAAAARSIPKTGTFTASLDTFLAIYGTAAVTLPSIPADGFAHNVAFDTFYKTNSLSSATVNFGGTTFYVDGAATTSYTLPLKGSTVFSNYSGTWHGSTRATAAQGAKADALAPAIISPSGDTSGVTDLANIQAAINALPTAGGYVYLVNSGSFFLPAGSTGIQIGNGTNSANSTKHGIRLVGIGKGGTVNGTRGGVIINSAVAGPAIQVNGPVSGWEVDGIEVNITSTSTAARGLKVISAQAGSVPYFACDISNPSQIAVEETTTTNTGAVGSNTMHNKWGHVHVWMSSTATNAIAWKSTGAAYPTFNTCNETVDNLEVYTNHATQTGVLLGAADTISFRQFVVWNSGVASKGIVFDYGNGQNAAWPADCTFFSMDIGTSTITNSGTPAGATKNKIFGMGLTNGGALPSLANLYVGDAPSLADLADWPAAVSAAEVGYLDGVVSGIQGQINSKAATSALPSTATASVAGLVTVSGTTAKAASVTGTLTQGKQATFDASGNLIASLYDTGATGGGAVNWGGIGGTLASQTDLNSALAGKQATLVNQTNIKSVNGVSLLGSGDLTVSSMTYPGAGVPVSTGSAWGTSLGYGFGANNLLQLNSDGNIFMKATNGTNTQVDLQTRNGAGAIVSDWIISATTTPQFTFYDAINGHNVIALTPGAPENSFAMDSAGKIGLGTGSPLFALHSLSSASQGAVLLLEDYFTGNGASGGIFGRFGRGSATSPLRGKANDRMFTIGARSAYAADDVSAGAMPGGNRVAINFFNAEDQTSSAQGSYISLLTTAPGSTTNSEKMRINGDGSIQMGGSYGAGFGAGNLSVLNGVSAKTFTGTIPAATTYGATTTIDLSLGDSPSVTLTGNPTLAFSNPVAGQWHMLELIQDATGGRTVTWPSSGLVCTWRNADGTTTAPTQVTTANSHAFYLIHTKSTTAADCFAR